MLEVVVHGAPSSELHTRAMIPGRNLMDRGDFREAAFQPKRAANLRDIRRMISRRAAVFLAMALLLDERPYDAGEAALAHRLQFQDRSVRNAAALMNSLARWRTASPEGKVREAGFMYRSIVACRR